MQSHSKKIAFILSSFRAGGGEKQLIEIANAFVKRGHQVQVLVLKPVGQYTTHVDPGVKVISLDAGRMLFSLPKLVTYLKREQPDALLSLDEYTHILSITARFFAKVQTRIVLRIGNMLSILAERYEGKARVLPFLANRLFKKADHIIANSRGVADDVVAVTKIDPSKITVILNPKAREEIIAKARESITHPWYESKTLPIIVAVGRLRVQKNFELLIRAFAKARGKMQARLVIVGTGREEGRLRELTETLHCEDAVYFAGYQDNPYAWMSKSDVYVASSLWEGLPNALIEAMICGLPAIAADCSSGPREILAPDTDYKKRMSVGDGVEWATYGTLYAVNDEDALAQGLERFVGDFTLRQSYATKSIERSKAFDAQDIVNEYAAVLGV